MTYYMKVSDNRHNDFTVGAYDGQPINFEIRAYESKEDRKNALASLFEQGGNGMFCTWKEVESYYGKDFEIGMFVFADIEYVEINRDERDPFYTGICMHSLPY